MKTNHRPIQSINLAQNRVNSEKFYTTFKSTKKNQAPPRTLPRPKKPYKSLYYNDIYNKNAYTTKNRARARFL